MSSGDVPAIVQARLSSSRLPGKVLLRLGGVTVLEQVIESTQRFANPVIVATSTDPSDDILASFVRDLGVACVRGPLEDVAARYQWALEQPEIALAEWFFRITADCPLVSAPLARAELEARSPQYDVLYFEDSALPRGIAPELVRKEAFLALQAEDLSASEREHVTLGLYRRRGERTLSLPVPEHYARPEFRLTLDYPDDYRLLGELFEHDRELTAEAALSLLAENERWATLNQACQTAVP